MAQFSVYKASAGSGKTFTVSKAFIRELLCDESAYRHILAVTFTNKATDEMKRRIVSYLADLAEGRAEPLLSLLIADFRTDLAEGQPLPPHIRRQMAMPDEESRQAFRQQAGRILRRILHDYSRLSVMTIDSFFQKIIRSFAMDTGLYAAYDLLLDSKEAVENAVDLYMSELQPDSAAKDWIAEIVEQRIDDGKNWDCRKDLTAMADILLREDSQAMTDEVFRKISDRDTVKQYGAKLQKIRQTFESDMKQDAREALRIMENNSLTVDDFANKKNGFVGYFIKLLQDKPEAPGKRATEACNDIEKWYSKNTADSTKKAIENAYGQGMNAALCRLVTRWQEHSSDYVSACAILAHLPEFGVMADLRQALQRYCNDQEVFLISQSNPWLRKIIDGADAPFIYERTGAHFRHYMIDEMQDTSQMQWDNLLPLLRDSMARGYADWTVGDVKQSIYRFRNSDWRIMAGQIGRDIPAAVEKHLQYNFRSEARIIEFNNLFFKTLSAQLANRAGNWEETWKELFLKIYSDVEQKIPEKKAAAPGGFVEMRFIPDKKENDWKEEALRALPAQLMQLQDLGYGAADIAVLVRDKKDAAMTVSFMLQWVREHPEQAGKYVFDMLYNEAQLIGDNLMVQWVIGALKYMMDPQEKINRTFLEYTAAQCLPDHPDKVFDLLDAWSDRCRSLSVYDAVAALTEDMDLYSHADDAPFLQAFQDALLKYCRRERVDTAAFLTYWEERKDKEYLMTPEQQEAIRLMTIHKAKGLEFDAVLMPFASWGTGSGHNDTVWMSTAGTAFEDIPQVLVSPSSKLENSIFAAQYAWECFLSCVDNINLLYVAFTRAGKVLMAQVPKKDKEGKAISDNVGRWICDVCRNVSETSEDWVWEDANTDRPYEICRSGVLAPRTGRATGNSQTGHRLNDLYRPSLRSDSGIQLKNSAEFFETPQAAAIGRGVVLHELFSGIRDLTDLPALVGRLAGEGKIPEHDREALADFVRQACSKEEVASWFAPGAKVKTESDLLMPDGTLHRPDRVVILPDCVKVIDYKFGNRTSPEHVRQVREYMAILKDMGYPDVKGYLWYVSLNRTVQVDS